MSSRSNQVSTYGISTQWAHLPGELRNGSIVDDAGALGRVAQELYDRRARLLLRVRCVEASCLTLQPLRRRLCWVQYLRLRQLEAFMIPELAVSGKARLTSGTLQSAETKLVP